MKFAEIVQSTISKSNPVETDLYEWGFSQHSTPEITVGDEIFNSKASDALMPEKEVESSATSIVGAAEVNKEYFNSRYSQLQAHEKEILFACLGESKSSEGLALMFELTVPVVNYTIESKLKFWLRRDKMEMYSVRSGLVEFISKNSIVRNDTDLVVDSSSDSYSADDNSLDFGGVDHTELVYRLGLLPSNAWKVLKYFSENPGQKTHVAASDLNISHLVMLSLLNGCLDDYLERDRTFIVTLKPGIHGVLVKAGIVENVWVAM